MRRKREKTNLKMHQWGWRRGSECKNRKLLERKKETSPAYFFNMRIERPILVRNSSRSPHRHHLSKICRAKYDKLSFIWDHWKKVGGGLLYFLFYYLRMVKKFFFFFLAFLILFCRNERWSRSLRHSCSVICVLTNWSTPTHRLISSQINSQHI